MRFSALQMNRTAHAPEAGSDPGLEDDLLAPPGGTPLPIEGRFRGVAARLRDRTDRAIGRLVTSVRIGALRRDN